MRWLFILLLVFMIAGCKTTFKVHTSNPNPKIEKYTNPNDSTIIEKHHLKDYLYSIDEMAKKMGIKVNYLEFKVYAMNLNEESMENTIVEIEIPGENNKILYTNKDGIAVFTLDRNTLEKDPICILKGADKYHFGSIITTTKVNEKKSGDGG